MALSTKSEKIQYLKSLIHELEEVLVTSINVGADRNEDTEEEIALFDMIKGGITMMELSYLVKYKKVSPEEADELLGKHIREVTGRDLKEPLFNKEHPTKDDNRFGDSSEVFNKLSEDKKKVMN